MPEAEQSIATDRSVLLDPCNNKQLNELRRIEGNQDLLLRVLPKAVWETNRRCRGVEGAVSSLRSGIYAGVKISFVT
jgi:hypothetical protein